MLINECSLLQGNAARDVASSHAAKETEPLAGQRRLSLKRELPPNKEEFMPQQLFELLKREHRQVEKWMTQIEDSSESERKKVFTTLQDALERHMAMEEKYFYPQLKKIKELKDLEADAIEEHEMVKNFLSRLEDLDVQDDKWISTFSQMHQGVLHHVQDEEKKIFPGCTKSMSAQLLREIGQKCSDEKERATSSRGSAGAQKTRIK